jgi:hypothetical protein
LIRNNIETKKSVGRGSSRNSFLKKGNPKLGLP